MKNLKQKIHNEINLIKNQTVNPTHVEPSGKFIEALGQTATYAEKALEAYNYVQTVADVAIISSAFIPGVNVVSGPAATAAATRLGTRALASVTSKVVLTTTGPALAAVAGIGAGIVAGSAVKTTPDVTEFFKGENRNW